MDTLNIRVEKKTKEAARKVLRSVGLDLSTGVKVFLHQVVNEKGLPFRPTNNPAALRAKWDDEVEGARKGRAYKNAKDALADL